VFEKQSSLFTISVVFIDRTRKSLTHADESSKPPDPNRAGEVPKQSDPNRTRESPTANSRFMSFVNRPPNLFKKKKKKKLARFHWNSVGRHWNPVGASPESLFEGYFGEKNQK
jgi:hypothetical protein